MSLPPLDDITFHKSSGQRHFMVAMQHALGSVYSNVGGNVHGDITSCEKQHQYMSTDTMNGWEKCQVRVTWWKKKLTSCDNQKNRKKNIIEQLNGTKHNVLPLPNKSWLGYGPCRITVSHYQAAAQQLTAYNRAKASLWSPYGKTWTVKRDTWGLWNHRLSQYRQRTLMMRWLLATAIYCMHEQRLQEQHGIVSA